MTGLVSSSPLLPSGKVAEWQQQALPAWHWPDPAGIAGPAEHKRLQLKQAAE